MIDNQLKFEEKFQNQLLNNRLKKKFSEKFNKIFTEIKKDIKNSSKTLNVLDNNFQLNFKIENLKKFKNFKTIAVIGMGGSILGAEAIYNFFKKKVKKKFYFFNNIDENKIKEFKQKEIISKTLFIVISKSGYTVETIANSFALNIFKKNSKNIILVSERNNNEIFLLSKKLNLYFVEHKKNIGGRYSVLSEVGMLPAYLMGLNISKLRSKILECLKEKNKKFLKTNTIKLAILMQTKKIRNLIFLNYFPELEKFLFWSQQLIAESLGKRKKGVLPVISNVPKDHHSLLQLYLDGPKDKLFNIFSFENKSKEKFRIQKNNSLYKKKLDIIKIAQKKALIKSFSKNKISFREFKIRSINEEVLGKLFSYFIIETIIVGKLLNINPFDQPAVEQVKIFTRDFLN